MHVHRERQHKRMPHMRGDQGEGVAWLTWRRMRVSSSPATRAAQSPARRRARTCHSSAPEPMGVHL